MHLRINGQGQYLHRICNFAFSHRILMMEAEDGLAGKGAAKSDDLNSIQGTHIMERQM